MLLDFLSVFAKSNRMTTLAIDSISSNIFNRKGSDLSFIVQIIAIFVS